MSNNSLIYLGVIAGLLVIGYFGWKMTSRSAYESAEYTVLKSDGAFEVREYPDLWMATTDMRFDSQGDDGSFMRLFRYISGDNQLKQKVAMTTPVFMDPESAKGQGQMGFVLPKAVASEQIPEPDQEGVEIQKRGGGKFAVIRFAGRSSGDQIESNTARLLAWIKEQGLVGIGPAEVAGYDPPWTPGPLRRNEILIRLK